MRKLRGTLSRLGYYSAAFVLAVSTLTAAVPFVLAERVDAISGTHQNLQDAIDEASDGDVINLTGNIVAEKQITVNKAITINGNNNTIATTFSKTNNSNNSALGIQSNNVTVQNLNVTRSSGRSLHGINIFNSQNVNLQNISVNNFNSLYSYGIVINGSGVTFSGNIATSGNGLFAGGVNVDNGSTLTVLGQHVSSDLVAVYVEGGTLDDRNKQYSGPISGRYGIKSAPSAPAIEAPSSLVKTSSVTASWTAPNVAFLQNAADSYLVSLNGAPAVSVSGLTYDLVGLTDGTYTLTVQSVAKSGLLGGVSTRTFNVTIPDTTAPIAELKLPVYSNKNFVIEGRASDDDVIESHRFEVEAPDGETYSKDISTSEEVVKISLTDTKAPVIEGEYKIRYVVTDKSGNSSDGSDGAGTVIVDKTKPTVAISGITNMNPQGFTVTSEDALSGIISKSTGNLYKYDIAKEEYVLSKSNSISGRELKVVFGNLEDGKYYVRYNASDVAGNISNTTQFYFEVDKTAPDAPVLTGDPVRYMKPGNVVRTWDKSSSEDVEHYIYKSFTSEADALNPDASSGWPQEYDAGKASYSITHYTGDYNRTFWYRVAAVDFAGNTTWSEEVFKVVVDKTEPTVSLSGLTELNPEGFTVTAKESLSGSGVALIEAHLYEYDPSHEDAEEDGYYFVERYYSDTDQELDVVFENLSDGKYSLRYSAYDRSGNVATGDEVEFVVDTITDTPEVLVSNADGISGTAEAGATVRVTVEGKTFEVIADENGNWPVKFTEPLNVGSHRYTVIAVDTADNESKVVSGTIIVDPEDDDDPDPTVTSGGTGLGTPTNTTSAAAAATPFQVGVLGDQDLNPDLTPEAATDDTSDIRGVTADKTAQAAGASEGLTFAGLAWYWWVLIGAAAIGFFWWLIAALRRKKDEE